VLASFERYKRVALLRNVFDNVASWETPDAATFVIHMNKVQPTFIQQISSFNLPIVIVPAEEKDDAFLQLRTVGTGPWMLDQFVPGSYVRLKRNPNYTPNTNFEDRTGFGGYKQACFDSVTFRIVTEAGARVAGMKTGELQGVEDIPATTVARSEDQPERRAAAVAELVDPDRDGEHLGAAHRQPEFPQSRAGRAQHGRGDGCRVRRQLSPERRFPVPDQADYTDAGKDTYNIHDPALAKKYLAASGYNGEPVKLLAGKDYAPMYNSALVMQQQLKSIGINAQMVVVDWPTSVNMALKPDTGWNYFYTGWGTPTALGALDTMQNLAGANATYMPKDGREDPDMVAAFTEMNQDVDPKARQDAFVRMQKLALERAYALPFGSYTKVQAVRANVQGYKPFRIPRMSNVWFAK